jgi:centractin
MWYNNQADRAWEFTPPLYGTPKTTQTVFMVAQKKFYVGWEAQSKRGMLTLTKLYQDGLVLNWECMAKLYASFIEHLEPHAKLDDPFLIIDSVQSSTYQRKELATTLFELDIKSLHITTSPQLLLYSEGLTSGIVLDSGHDKTIITVVHHGKILFYKEHNVAGAAISRRIASMLSTDYSFTGMQLELLADAYKFSECAVLDDYYDEQARQQASVTGWDWPNITVPRGEMTYVAPECLFKPELLGSREPGIHLMLLDVIKRCPEDMKYIKVIITGGTTRFKNFFNRFSNEIKSLGANVQLIDKSSKEAVVDAATKIQSETWFKDLFVSKEEFEENEDVVKSFSPLFCCAVTGALDTRTAAAIKRSFNWNLRTKLKANLNYFDVNVVVV